METRIEEAVGTLVRQDGRVRTGRFRLPFRQPGLVAANPFDSRWLHPLLPLQQRWWYGFAVTHPQVYLATIVIDLSVARISSLYLVERNGGLLHEWDALVVDPRRGQLAGSPWNGHTFVHASGHRVDYWHRLELGRHDIHIEIPAKRGRPALRVDLAMLEEPERQPPLVVSVPAIGRWYMYTHKAHGPAEGRIRLGDHEYRFDRARDLANIDEHRAAWPWRQDWTWGTFSLRGSAGDLLAVNLCDNPHYTDPEKANENGLWVGGRLDSLGAVEFRFDPGDPLRPWNVTDSAGRIDLVFRPQGAKRQHTSLGPVRLDYFQAYGTWHGKVIDTRGQVREVAEAWGVAEQGRGRN